MTFTAESKADNRIDLWTQVSVGEGNLNWWSPRNSLPSVITPYGCGHVSVVTHWLKPSLS